MSHAGYGPGQRCEPPPWKAKCKNWNLSAKLFHPSSNFYFRHWSSEKIVDQKVSISRILMFRKIIVKIFVLSRFFTIKFLTPIRVPLTPLSEHLPPTGLLAHERPRGKVVPYCDLTAELTKWENELSDQSQRINQSQRHQVSHCTSILFARATKNLLRRTQRPKENFNCADNFFKTYWCAKPRVAVYFRAHDIIFFILAKHSEAETLH